MATPPSWWAIISRRKIRSASTPVGGPQLVELGWVAMPGHRAVRSGVCLGVLPADPGHRRTAPGLREPPLDEPAVHLAGLLLLAGDDVVGDGAQLLVLGCGRARGRPSPRPGRGGSACPARSRRRRPSPAAPRRGWPRRPARPRHRGGARPGRGARHAPTEDGGRGRVPVDAGVGSGAAGRWTRRRTRGRRAGHELDVAVGAGVGGGVGMAPSLPPVQAPPGSGVCGPWRYFLTNSSSRGSSAPVSWSCTPHALATTGAGSPSRGERTM